LGRRLVFTPSGIWSVAETDCESMAFSRWRRPAIDDGEELGAAG
jgi:hypothetical protein